jgi:hypothetical protein
VAELTVDQELDGKGDEFCSITPFELNFANADSTETPDLKQKAIVRIAWTATNFAAFIDVTDAEIATKASLDELWGGDNIEIYLAPDATAMNGHFKGENDGVQMSFAPESGDKPARGVRLYFDDGGSQKRNELTSGFKSVLTDTGYAIELQIPWSSFGGSVVTIKAGSTIGFDMALSTANASTLGANQDGREGSALMFVGPAKSGVDSCGDSDELPWCNSTTWCTATLE